MRDEVIHTTQRSFRQVMNAFAFPGSVRFIEPYPAGDEGNEVLLSPYLEMTLRLFVDQAVTFAVVGADSVRWERYIALQTHARPVEAAKAEYLLVPSADDALACRTAVAGSFGGTLIAPERGAFVAIACGMLSARPQTGLARFAVAGPGVKNRTLFSTNRTDWARARAERGDEYPCGIEILLVADDGAIVALPRTTRIAKVSADRDDGDDGGEGPWDM